MGNTPLGMGNPVPASIELREIPHTGGKYAAGSDGHIYCYSTARNNRQKPSPFQVAEAVGSNGYAFIGTLLSGTKKTRPVHSLILQAFAGPRPYVSSVSRHLDGDKLNNTPRNLLWGTQAENEADKRRHGRVAQGERQGIAKLTDEAVRIIRASISLGLWDTENAAKVFGVSQQHIAAIARGRGWQHVQ